MGESSWPLELVDYMFQKEPIRSVARTHTQRQDDNKAKKLGKKRNVMDCVFIARQHLKMKKQQQQQQIEEANESTNGDDEEQAIAISNWGRRQISNLAMKKKQH